MSTLTVKHIRRLLRGSRLGRALAGGSDLVLGAVANGIFEQLGLLLDRAQSVLDGVVGGAEVSGDVANVDLERIVSHLKENGANVDDSP